MEGALLIFAPDSSAIRIDPGVVQGTQRPSCNAVLKTVLHCTLNCRKAVGFPSHPLITVTVKPK